MRYPKPDGTTMSQIELYSAITDPMLDLSPIATIVEPALRAAQADEQEQYVTPVIYIG